MRIETFKIMWIYLILISGNPELSSSENRANLLDVYLPPIELKESSSSIFPIDCIYVINLDARFERWQRTEALCARYSLTPNRVGAVNGWAIPQEEQERLALPYPCRLGGGQLGCLLSHLSILKDAWQRNFDLIWVLEDDVEFIEDPRQLPELLAQLSQSDPDWDILYTDTDFRNKRRGYTRPLDNDFPPDWKNEPPFICTERIPISKDLMRIRSRYGTHSMLISRRGIKKIREYYASRPHWTAIDIELHYIPTIREYSTRRDIVSNLRHSLSDTQSNTIWPCSPLRSVFGRLQR